MVISDTSIWIEFLKNNEPFFKQMKELLEDREILGIECIFGELFQGVKNKREKEIIASYWNNIPKINEHGLWIEAGKYSYKHKFIDKGIGLIDTLIIITAIKTNSLIWTLDIKLQKILGAMNYKRK